MSKCAVCRLAVLTLVLTVLLAAPVSAYRDPGCFKNMASCFEGSALIESFWYRTWEALDCELGFISCVRIAVFGL